jgi:hypothetical protein
VSGITAHANPIILDSAGRVPGGEIWLTSGSEYKFVIETATGILLNTYDSIFGINDLSFITGTVSSTNVTFLQAGSGAVTRTAQNKMREEISVKDFGAVGDGVADDTNAFLNAVAALPASGGTIVVPDATGYLITASIECPVPVLWKIGSTTITANLTGYLFDIQANRSGIEGGANSVLKAGTGCTALIFNNQTLNCHYWNLELDLNSVVNVVGLYHYGGWYLSAKNLHVDISKELASAHTLKIEGIDLAVPPIVPGPTGSYGGVFVSTYDNINGGLVRIIGTVTQKATTLTFTGCSLTQVVAENALSLTFLQPIIQSDKNFFDLTNVSGVTCLGGDFEITGPGGQIYVLQGGLNRDIVSIGNQTNNVTTSNYLVGTPGIGCVFDDKTIIGADDEVLRFGVLPSYSIRNQGWSHKQRLGPQYSGDKLVLSNNIKMISNTQGNLDNTALSGLAIFIDLSGQMKIFFASAGANPRNLTQYAMFDGLGLQMETLPSSNPGAGTKRFWYDPADSNRVKFSP